MSFDFEHAPLDGVILIKPEVYKDERGYLLETFKKDSFAEEGITTDFVLEFYSKSQKRVLRGLHQQTHPFQQAKIIRCFSGEIFDVVVDVRPTSDTFGEYVSYRLTEENKYSVYIPQGFLHGFVTLSDQALVYYKVDNKYAPNYEQGVIWNDSAIDIAWPVDDPIVSEKDEKWPPLHESVYMKS